MVRGERNGTNELEERINLGGDCGGGCCAADWHGCAAGRGRRCGDILARVSGGWHHRRHRRRAGREQPAQGREVGRGRAA